MKSFLKRYWSKNLSWIKIQNNWNLESQSSHFPLLLSKVTYLNGNIDDFVWRWWWIIFRSGTSVHFLHTWRCWGSNLVWFGGNVPTSLKSLRGLGGPFPTHRGECLVWQVGAGHIGSRGWRDHLRGYYVLLFHNDFTGRFGGGEIDALAFKWEWSLSVFKRPINQIVQ